MANQNWRDLLDPSIRGHLELQLKEVYSQKRAYMSASDPKNAQMLCAVATLSKQLFALNSKIKQLEATIEDLKPKKKTTRKRRSRKKSKK